MIDPTVGTLAGEPAADVPEVLTTTRARLLEREGIAMVVALDDVRPGRELQVADATALAEGTRLAALLDHYYAGLEAIGFPPQFPEEPDETGSPELIDALVVLSDQHLRARTEDGR